MTGGESPDTEAAEQAVETLEATAREDDPSRLLHDAPDVISRLALNGEFLYASRAAAKLFGHAPEALLGTRLIDWLEPVDRREALVKFRRLESGEREVERITVQIRHPDGTWVWTDSIGSVAVDPQSGERTIVVVTRLAHEAVETERALKRLEERFRAMVEWIPAVVYEAEPGEDGRFLYVSPQIELLLGYTAEEWMADQNLWADRLHPEDREWVIALEDLQAEQAAADGERMIGGEYRMIHRDGHVIQVRDVARMTGPDDGTPYWRGVLLNVTTERSAELTLREAHDSYRRMVDGLPACVYRAVRGHNGAFVFVSSQIQRLLGYTPGEMIADPTLWAASLHADDRDRVEQAEADVTDQPPGTQYVNEYRLRTRTGKMIWVRDRAVLTVADDGRPMMDGLLVDISAERMAVSPDSAVADLYRLGCADCGYAWPAERLEPCPECKGINVDGVSLNATLTELASSRRQVEGLLDGIHRHLEALGTNLRTVSDQLAFGTEKGPADEITPAGP